MCYKLGCNGLCNRRHKQGGQEKYPKTAVSDLGSASQKVSKGYLGKERTNGEKASLIYGP
jgi:hypothetical protein